MSYQITIVGHLDGDNAPVREASILEAARRFAETIEGVSSATFDGSFGGRTDIMPVPGPSLAEPVAAVEPFASEPEESDQG